MTEHKVCNGCKWNNYPTCSGTIMQSGNEMNIENLTKGFGCGQKELDGITDFSIKIKSDLEKQIEEIIKRLEKLEKE